MPKNEVFRSMDQIMKRYRPMGYAEELEREKLKNMTPDEQARYVGNKMAQQTLKTIYRAMKRISA